jgi:hypothetical protein
LSPLTHVAKHENRAVRGIGNLNRRAAIIDSYLLALAIQQDSMVRQGEHYAFAQSTNCRIFDHGTTLFVDDHKDTFERQTSRFMVWPAGQLLGDRIQKRHLRVSIDRDDAITDARQRYLKPLLCGCICPDSLRT